MDFGAMMFHTDYSMPIVDLARACEARGFESLWAPEHSHIPLTRKTPYPGGGELPKMYQDEMEDHGTVYATRFKRMREQVEAMRAIWTEPKPEYHGEIIDFPPMMTWPKPVQQPLPIIVGGAFPHAARRAVRYGNGWIPIAGRASYGNFDEYFPVYKQMLAEAGRSLADAPITMFGAAEDYDQLARYRDLGVARVVAWLASEGAD